MELAPPGRLIASLGVSLLMTGFLVFNTLILFSAVMLLLYLLSEGMLFHRAVGIARDSIKLESHPSTIETTVGRQVRMQSIVTNHSHLRFQIAGFSRNLPLQFDEETHISARLTLGSNAVQSVETQHTPTLAGNFESATSTVLLEGRASLFRQSLRIPDKVIIIAKPLASRSVEPIEAGALADLTVDHLRRGTGIDLASIRPFNVRDEFHTIDWKATARTGKLMTRESYLEREPAIMLMIDVSSSMNTGRRESSIFEGLLNEAGNLLMAIRPESPLGLILFDERRVIANIEASGGVNSRERILRALLEATKPTSAPASAERLAIRPYTDLARETDSLMRGSAFAAKTRAYLERFSLFASSILPFYERAESKYFERLKGQGVFRAFEIICTFPEPVLVIVISDGQTNLGGLAEGAKNARILNHQVVLAILAVPEPTRRIEILSDLEGQGVGILRCRPEELSRAINAEILKLSHARTIPIDAAR